LAIIFAGSAAGRFLGSVLILLGIGLFSMLTVSFSAYFYLNNKTKYPVRSWTISRNYLCSSKKTEKLEREIDRLSDKK
jgi:voltage-gated potassium channel